MQYFFAYISAPQYRSDNYLYLKHTYGCHLSFEICHSFLNCLLAKKIKETKVGRFFWDTLYKKRQIIF